MCRRQEADHYPMKMLRAKRVNLTDIAFDSSG